MGKLTFIRVNKSTAALSHSKLGPVGMLAVGTKGQPDTVVFYAQYPLWTMDTLRDVLAIMSDCEVSKAAPEFALARGVWSESTGETASDASRDETVSPPGGGEKSTR